MRQVNRCKFHRENTYHSWVIGLYSVHVELAQLNLLISKGFCNETCTNLAMLVILMYKFLACSVD